MKRLLYKMHFNFKDIHIGEVIFKITQEKEIDEERIVKFLKKTDVEIKKMYESKDLSSDLLLLWSKLLEYDLFRLYSQHLLLYSSTYQERNKNLDSKVPRFKKNIYTVEIIEFIVELFQTGEKTVNEIVKEYNIPKTTVMRWIQKYQKQNDTEL